MISKQFVAVRGVIVKNGKVLIIRESNEYATGVNHGHYDFPGGKIKLGENIEDSLIRETKEEAGIDIKIIQAFFACDWRPIVKGEQLQIIGIFYLCEPLSTDIHLSQAHDDFKWILLEERTKYPLLKEKVWALEKLLSLKLI